MKYIQYVRIRIRCLAFANSDVPFCVLKNRKFLDELSNSQILGKTPYLGVVTTQFYQLLFWVICCNHRRFFKYVCHFESIFQNVTPL